MYALNLSSDGRILSATYPEFAPEDAIIVDILPDGDISDYLYINGEYIYDPLPAPEEPETEESESGDSVWDELDAAYQAGYEEGYTEGVNSAYGNE